MSIDRCKSFATLKLGTPGRPSTSLERIWRQRQALAEWHRLKFQTQPQGRIRHSHWSPQGLE
ncbi:hypothetical protein TRAPUB_9388 [Trametes pubescens]|uniref:Uncharacterized protein n=1 Tax=Trametes pubescens TaxID=154538 RepID=A0A1M2W2H4_TRAPU|nr:hypothetical protein TRAPUB_9388 [Trametes pubescens]